MLKDINRKCAYVLFCSVMSDYLQHRGWTVACQAPLSSGFPRQEHANGPTPGDLPDPGLQPMSPMIAALEGGFFTTELPGKQE